MTEEKQKGRYPDRVKKYALVISILLFFYMIFFVDLDPGNVNVTRAAAVAMVMAILWMTEAIPLAATALLPVCLFPILGVMDGKEVAPLYFNSIIFLFIGGFVVALAMEKWNLHKRIALKILLMVGTRPKRILLGFMGSTWFLSMWVSNTATAMMMVSIAIAVIIKFEDLYSEEKVKKFSIGLLLGVAYSASIGGLATLIGTPPNLSLVRIYQIYFPEAPEISFSSWFIFAFPISLTFLIIVWVVLSFLFCRDNTESEAAKNIFKDEYEKLGKRSYEETMVLLVFVSMAFLWLTRSDINLGSWLFRGWASRLSDWGILSNVSFIDDGTVAITMALILFMIPSKNGETHFKIMDWKIASKIPWHIILLFGGGFALASGFKESGLSSWIGSNLGDLGSLHPILMIAIVCTLLTFMTELTSNTGSVEMILPILAGIAVTLNISPLLLMIPAALSASCAFMLPVATPPNAIVFGSGRVQIRDMVRAGIIFNLIGIVLVVIFIYLSAYVIEMDIFNMPVIESK